MIIDIMSTVHMLTWLNQISVSIQLNLQTQAKDTPFPRSISSELILKHLTTIKISNRWVPYFSLPKFT